VPDRTTVSQLFGLEGDAWMRHANPASVWTRFAVLPLLVLGVWSRTWIGWLCLIPIGLLIVWLVVNPRFFDRPASTAHWASRSVFGERLWTERKRRDQPEDFQSSVPAVAQGVQVIGLVPMVYGLVVFNIVVTLRGLLIVQVAKCWYLDRMVLMFDAVKRLDSEVAAWEY
jgi:hypothetical protein